MTRVHLSVGSNRGNAKAAIQEACGSAFGLNRTALVRVSSLYRTIPVGDPRQPTFLNAACTLDTALSPDGLLEGLQACEVRMGRVPPGRPGRTGPRSLDLDILDFGDQIIEKPGLRIPHPALVFRRFVLVPLSEIDAFWNHPVLGKTPGELLNGLGPLDEIRWAGPPPWIES